MVGKEYGHWNHSQKSLRSVLESWNHQRRGLTFLFMEVKVLLEEKLERYKRNEG